MKPVIGITAHFVLNGDEIGVKPGYLDFVRELGGLPLMLPLTSNPQDIEQLLDHIDGIILTGGVDVNPLLYGEEPFKQTQRAYKPLDDHESALIPAVLKRDMPLFAICRGMQMLNVILGGDLYQDISTQLPQAHTHDMTPPFTNTWHRVTVQKGAPLYDAVGTYTLEVNSKHHQAVRRLAEGFVVDALSDDGLIEAIHMEEKRYVRAVQWHPELLWREHTEQRAMLAGFIDACKD